MTTTATFPSIFDFQTQHATGGWAEQTVLNDAMFRIQGVLRAQIPGLVPTDLLDYLAARVESHDAQALAGMFPDNAEAQEKIEAHAKAVHAEAARTFLVAFGIPTANMAPIDFPTVTRYWIACRNAMGWRP